MRNRMAHLALSVLAVIGLGTGTALAVKCTAKVATAISVIDPAVCSKLRDANRDLASEQLDRYEYISGRHGDGPGHGCYQHRRVARGNHDG